MPDITFTGANGAVGTLVTPTVPLPVALGTGATAPPADGTNGAALAGVATYYWDQGSSVWQKVRGAAMGSVDGTAGAWNGFGGLITHPFPHIFTSNGWDRLRSADKVANVLNLSITAATPQTVITPTAGKKVRVLAGALSLSVAGYIMLKYGAGNTEFLRVPAVLAGDNSPFLSGTQGLMPGAANDVIKIDVSATGSVNGWIAWMEE